MLWRLLETNFVVLTLIVRMSTLILSHAKVNYRIISRCSAADELGKLMNVI